MSTRRGVLAFVVVAVALGTAFFLAALALRRPLARSSSAPAVLVFDVPAVLDEGPLPPRPFPFGRTRRSRLTVYDVTHALRRAAEDEHVGGLVLHIGTLDWGWAKVAEVRAAVAAVRRAGKPVFASLAGGGEREYLLASAAGRIGMPPTADLRLDGLSATATYFRGTFDKLGIAPNFVYVGRFKSGVEPYTRTGMSPDARLALARVLDGLYGVLVDSLAAARHMTPDSVRRLVDGGPYVAAEARERGLVDTLLYAAEMDTLALRRGARRLPTTPLGRYASDLARVRGGPRVALVTATGTIVGGRSRERPGEDVALGSETLVEALRQARLKRSIKAIVLRIDSPGGVAQASDDIWREVERCRAAKPVIVSMSDVAASGGYYIAVAADSIVAEPATLTGSIGVYGGKLNVLGLYRKLGLNVEIMSRGRHAEMLSPFRDFTDEEARVFRHGLESFYRGFVARVARGRRLSEAVVDSLAEGRVWCGLAALPLGLVDRLGGIETAFAMARDKAGFPVDEELVVERFPRIQRSFLERWLEDLLTDDDGAADLAMLPPLLRAWRAVAGYPAGTAMALMPYSIEVR